MKTRLVVTTAIAVTALIGQMTLPASALPQPKKTQHSLFCTCSSPPDTHLVCGTNLPNKPYLLHVSCTALSTGNGGCNITFRDGDAMGFSALAGSTLSTTQGLGGVPGVDTPRVMITPTGSTISMMASVLAEEGTGAVCVSCTGGVSGGTGTAGAGDPPECTFP